MPKHKIGQNLVVKEGGQQLFQSLLYQSHSEKLDLDPIQLLLTLSIQIKHKPIFMRINSSMVALAKVIHVVKVEGKEVERETVERETEVERETVEREMEERETVEVEEVNKYI
jgi:hypothetical protein